MIAATFDGATHLTVEGHAGAGVFGKDIVCAGVSAIVGSLAWILEELQADELAIDTERGFADISCAENAQTRQAFRQSYGGLKLIERDNRDYLTVRLKR